MGLRGRERERERESEGKRERGRKRDQKRGGEAGGASFVSCSGLRGRRPVDSGKVADKKRKKKTHRTGTRTPSLEAPHMDARRLAAARPPAGTHPPAADADMGMRFEAPFACVEVSEEPALLTGSSPFLCSERSLEAPKAKKGSFRSLKASRLHSLARRQARSRSEEQRKGRRTWGRGALAREGREKEKEAGRRRPYRSVGLWRSLARAPGGHLLLVQPRGVLEIRNSSLWWPLARATPSRKFARSRSLTWRPSPPGAAPPSARTRR